MINSSPDNDQRIRLMAFEWLSKQTKMHGEVLPRILLEKGFEFEGKRVPLIGPQGIFKPQVMLELPISITTSPKGPYDDSFGKDDLLMYRYRGTDPRHRDNVGLRTAMEKQIPLIYFHGVVPGKYLAVWPVYIVGDMPSQHTFKVAADDPSYLQKNLRMHEGLYVAESQDEPRRAYITSIIRQRLHQKGFRERVLQAYREQCACCKLRHVELLDAAHIIADTEPEGAPIVQNGIALCKLHHAAFDSNIIGIRPDYIVEVRKDVLKEKDGPMLLYGLQNLHGIKIILPKPERLHPSTSLLEKRYVEYRQVG
jgi:putative restriction endonuclease